MEKLSQHFQLSEFVRTEDEGRARSSCPDFKIRLMTKLIKPLLEPLRIHLGSPVTILSGYRTLEHNSAIGGKPHSHHLFEADRLACDFTCPDMPAAWKWLAEYNDRFCYAYWDKQMNFIHISGLTGTDRRVGVMWTV